MTKSNKMKQVSRNFLHKVLITRMSVKASQPVKSSRSDVLDGWFGLFLKKKLTTSSKLDEPQQEKKQAFNDGWLRVSLA